MPDFIVVVRLNRRDHVQCSFYLLDRCLSYNLDDAIITVVQVQLSHANRMDLELPEDLAELRQVTSLSNSFKK